MDVLVVGSGAREYELGRQLSLSSKVKNIYFANGNGGTAKLHKAQNIELSPIDVEGITAFVSRRKIDLTVIGPEAPLFHGLSNALRAQKAAVFGPSQEAAKLETSKAFAADFMKRHNISQPKFWVTHSYRAAADAIKTKKPETYVLKADGLAGGKGVILPSSEKEALITLKQMYSGQGYSAAGKEAVIIQERLHGPEVSALAVTDGKNFKLLPFSQDHKRLKDADKGPNTGGMGAYAPLPGKLINSKQAKKIEEIASRSIEGMAKEGTLYQGVLYLGLMLAEELGGEPVVIEYNARFGDPEAQVVLPVLNESGFDVADMLIKTARGNVADIIMPKKLRKAALTVYLTARGYPQSPQAGDTIHGLNKSCKDVIIQHAGTAQRGPKVVTAGGRVLSVTGLGKTVNQASKHAYVAIGPQGIHFEGMQYRKDIGYQART